MDPNVLGKFRILILDDNQEIHDDFIKILSNKSQDENFEQIERELFNTVPVHSKTLRLPDFQIDSCFQGQDTIELVKNSLSESNPYAIAFVDVRMPPGWDGINTAREMWKIDPNIQIVICTAFSDYSWEDIVKELGMSDSLLIIKKPFDALAVRQLCCALAKKWLITQQLKEKQELTEQQLQQTSSALKKLATHDPLTSLPNRTLLIDRLTQSIIAAEKNKNYLCLFYLDIDRFKFINDTLTYNVGDKLLLEIAKRLQSYFSDYKDTVARVGRDEFVILQTGITKEEQAIFMAEKIMNEIIRKPFNIDDREINITVSMGIVLFPKNGLDAETLLRNLDHAIIQAKKHGVNTFRFYTDDMNSYSLEQLELENELRHAIDQDQFILYYQPEFNLATGEITGVEALVRWRHPKRGMVSPLEFIPLAEETGLIVPLGEWVLRKACEQNKAWQKAGMPAWRIAVNMASLQFKQDNIVSTVEKILDTTMLAPYYLEIELTENIIINNDEIINKVFELKQLGVQTTLDDFGTGYTSLNSLKKLPLNRIKIDKSYIQNIGSNKDDEAIIQAIIAIALSLNLKVLAEGVETKEQANFLRKLNCQEAQGFLFCKPMPHDELIEFCKSNKFVWKND